MTPLDLILDHPCVYLAIGLTCARVMVAMGMNRGWFAIYEPVEFTPSECPRRLSPAQCKAFHRQPHRNPHPKAGQIRTSYGNAGSKAAATVLFWPLIVVWLVIFWRQPVGPAELQSRIAELEKELGL